MTDDVVIQADELGNKRLIGHLAKRERYIALRDESIRGRHNLWRKSMEIMRPKVSAGRRNYKLRLNVERGERNGGSD